MRIVAAAIALTAAVSTIAPASGQTYLDRLVASATRSKKHPDAVAATPVGRTLAPITPDQSAAIDRALAQPLQDPAVASDRTEAAPLIRTLLSTGSCAIASEAWNGINRQLLQPRTFSGFLPGYTPTAETQYHDKARCLVVVRLGDWSKPAGNAVKFRAYYVAADSGEAKRQSFVLQKGSDGQWLLRDINPVDF